MTLVLRVSGADGVNGRNGFSSAISSGGYKDGNNGENATKPTSGSDAGDIDLELTERYSTIGVSIEFSGRYCMSGTHAELFKKIYTCATVNWFTLEARGGNGGHGGNGGNGGNGATGTPGVNATRHRLISVNDEDTPLEPMEEEVAMVVMQAQELGHGADGGKGGTITLRMHDTDSGLLMMFVKAWTPKISYSLNVSGGDRGKAGHHGIPGCGGPGGIGGSSYSWTETSYSYDSQGNQVAYTTTYCNPGGMSGFSGNSGRKPTHLLYDGRTGDNGNLRFLIKDSVTNKVTTYSEIFDIRLYHVVARSATGVFEPEAQIHIDNLTVHNISTMPTPRRMYLIRRGDICLTINDSTWIHNRVMKEHTMLPHLIEPRSSQKVYCHQPFSFFLKKHAVNQPGPPLRATDMLHLTATMTGLQRVFPAFDINGRPINIKYPIEFTHISHMNSMVVGHVVKVLWGVRNTSEVDFGAFSQNGRRIRVRLDKTGGEVSRSALQFGLHPKQQGTATVPPVQTMESEYIFEIPLLRAGQTLHLEASLKLSEAEPFECAEFWLYLELGKIATPSIPKVVHIQSFDVRVSTIYRGFPAGFHPDILLVANHKTTRKEYLAWVNLIKQQLGLRFFVWDISQMGHFDFTRPIPTLFSNVPTTLMKDLIGKSMIILDNTFEYGNNAQKVTARNFMLKDQWLQAIHETDNKFVSILFSVKFFFPLFKLTQSVSNFFIERFYVVNPSASINACVAALDELIKTPFEARRQNKFTFERVNNFTRHLIAKTDDSSKDAGQKDENSMSDDNESILTRVNSTKFLDDASVDTAGPTQLIDEIIEVQIKAKLFHKMETRMAKKATKVDDKLKKLRPHIQHLVLYRWHKAKKSLFQNSKSCEKTGGCITIVPSMTTTKRRVIFAAAAWDESPMKFISTTMNLRGVIASLGIDIHFRLLERIFVTGPFSEDNETDDIYLFLTGGHRILNESEKQLAEILKQQIVYDIVVELSIICDGIGSNSSLGDVQVLEMMENLQRLVWKVESLSGRISLPVEETEENLLPTISEEHENTSYHTKEPDQVKFDQNNYYGDVGRKILLIHGELAMHNVPGTTTVGDFSEKTETILYMFPVRQDTPLGEWMLDALAQLYAYIKCLRAGIHQSLLPNRRTAKVQQQSMDLLHRIGDATIVDFTDPRSSVKLESLRQKQSTAFENQASIINKELPALPESPIVNDEKSKRLLPSMSVRKLTRTPSNSTSSSTLVSNQSNKYSVLSSSMSIASGLSFASAMSSATRASSFNFFSSGTSASRSRIPYKQLDPKRRQTIKSFKRGAKSQLRNMIQEHYKKWKKSANYRLGGIFDPTKNVLRRNAMEAIFRPFESLVDNTLYGRNLQKKRDGQVGGVKNIIVSVPKYAQQRAEEAQRINSMADMISNFFDFKNKMINGSIKVFSQKLLLSLFQQYESEHLTSFHNHLLNNDGCSLFYETF
ncbi:4005_t:CDS:10 [Ambispora gerdemannii]|uniref:4005_t:CDS:1 n=1 Tax=Ambispora gerdemannii TaxID=144530 RepID=A0A9N9FVR4_9GLOM|nr:4005_t:CDS:10 [Ambispora gerdemannii]